MSSDEDYELESGSSEEEDESESVWKFNNENDKVFSDVTSAADPPTHRSGSMTTLPKSIRITDEIFTDKQYLRRMQVRGTAVLNTARWKRRRMKKSIENVGLHALTDNIVALQPSSSEDGSDDDRRIDFPAIDWGQAEWGQKDSLFRHLPLSRFSSLIGWAHYLKTDDDCPFNHLLGVPSIPLAPSMLKFVVDHAFVASVKPQRVTWKRKSFVAREDHAEIRLNSKHSRERKRLNRHKRFWVHNSDDESYKWMKEHWKPTEAFDVTVPVPSGTRTEFNEPIALETSAQVALGMLIEEILTDSLIPIARHHVASCREKADAFDDWTLPAGEAILACSSSSPLPSSVTVDGKNDPELVERWCKSRGLDVHFVHSNMHIYSKLLPLAPIITNASFLDHDLTH